MELAADFKRVQSSLAKILIPPPSEKKSFHLADDFSLRDIIRNLTFIVSRIGFRFL